MKSTKLLVLLLLLLLNLCSVTESLGQAAQQQQDSLILGNPSRAKTDLIQPDDYLVAHDGFALSYNKSRGAANWVAWHLERADIGDAERTNAFAPDTTLPRDWWIKPNDYTGSGYDRGHLCPSKDRSSSEETNRETFLMSNMQPQAPKLNQKTWKYLEDYERELAKNNEEYIFAGCYGDRGRIANKITIPTNCWKIIVVLPAAEGDDLKRINKATRVIAVDMPNDETVSQRWRTYLTSVSAVEKKTGYDFLSNVPVKIQRAIESAKDEQSETKTPETKPSESKPAEGKLTKPAATKKADTSEREYILGPRGGCYYLNSSGRKTYVGKDKCSLKP
jgi:endonuclease G